MDRVILTNGPWEDVTTFRLYIWLIANATYMKGTMIGGIELQQGEYLRSYGKLAEDLQYKEGRGLKKVSKSTIKRAVDLLVKKKLISVRETEYGTIFTVIEHTGGKKKVFVERSQNECRTI
ncbi:hypothetical protein [Bacillus sp. FSL K6-3431]|uniref:hypothetical protein n=1 Tax=Bacillus sp. FSL K6-3431 TaxID=2921500 RepID=UPI0030FADEA6